MSDAKRYQLTIRENGSLIDDRPMADPFHTTRICPRGWRVLWSILLRRYELVVRVDAPMPLVNAVMRIGSGEEITQ